MITVRVFFQRNRYTLLFFQKWSFITICKATARTVHWSVPGAYRTKEDIAHTCTDQDED